MQQDHPGAKRPCYYEPQGCPAHALEDSPPAPQHHRVDQQPVFVDQAMPHQRAHKLTTAADQDVPAGLLLQLGYLIPDVPYDQP